MRTRRTARVLAAGALLLAAGAGLWQLAVWRAERRGPDPREEAEAPADPELERLRAEIEAERVAQLTAERAALPEPPAPSPRAPLATGRFSHAEHRSVACLDCHSASDAHGAVTVTELSQCRECHHTPPLARDCTLCHTASDFQGERRRVTQTFDLSVADPVARELVFAHVQHPGVSCAACHGESLTMAVTARCADCHQDHHQPGVQCMACHTAPPRAAHTVAAHLGCATAGCHDPPPPASVLRTRSLCLVCHQELVDHEPGRNCADCHLLPPPRTPPEAEGTGAARTEGPAG